MTRSLPPSFDRFMPCRPGKVSPSSNVKACVQPESNHTSSTSRTCSQSSGLSTRPFKNVSLAPSRNQTSAPSAWNAASMRWISSSDLSNGDIFRQHVSNIDVKLGKVVYLWRTSTLNPTTRVYGTRALVCALKWERIPVRARVTIVSLAAKA